MAFRLQDLCKTTRRSTGHGLPRLFPRILGDDRLDPRLHIAIRFFETNLGQPRRALDAEALVALFGDPRLARGLVRCLARTYSYCPRPLADVLGTARATALAARGLATPRDLRTRAYERANQDGGFVAPERRTDFLADLLEGLGANDLERALWLDAPDQAVLVRDGPMPTAADIRTCYNVQVLETVLGTSPESHFALRGDRALVEAVAARHAVRVGLNGTTVTLYGQSDAVGSWTRHGTRVARVALTLLGNGTLGPGRAIVQRAEQRYEVRLDAPFLSKALPQRCWAAPASTWDVPDTVVQAIHTLRRHGRLAGWRLSWWPEPFVAAPGLLWPELTLHRGATRIGLLPLTTTQLAADAVALGGLAERLSCIILAHPEVPPDLPPQLRVVPSRDAHLAGLLADQLEPNEVSNTGDALPEWLGTLLSVIRSVGSLAESDLAQRLGCTAEEVQSHLAALADTAGDVVYIDGFGLCTASLLAHARTLVDEETAGHEGQLDLTRLGRRLREVVGHNEGLHALIATVSGVLRPVA